MNVHAIIWMQLIFKCYILPTANSNNSIDLLNEAIRPQLAKLLQSIVNYTSIMKLTPMLMLEAVTMPMPMPETVMMPMPMLETVTMSMLETIQTME